MGIRLWSEIPLQHRATEELLAALNEPYSVLGQRYRGHPWLSPSVLRTRLLGIDPYGNQCCASLKAIRCSWDSAWVSRDPPPDRNFTTAGYYKRYLRCPEHPNNGADLCRFHGGPKHETRSMMTITFTAVGRVGDFSQTAT